MVVVTVSVEVEYVVVTSKTVEVLAVLTIIGSVVMVMSATHVCVNPPPLPKVTAST